MHPVQSICNGGYSAAFFVLLPSHGRTFGGYLLCHEVVEFMVRGWFEFYDFELFFASCCEGQTSDLCIYVCIYVKFLKGKFTQKLKFHPFAAHPYVDGGSDDTF